MGLLCRCEKRGKFFPDICFKLQTGTMAHVSYPRECAHEKTRIMLTPTLDDPSRFVVELKCRCCGHAYGNLGHMPDRTGRPGLKLYECRDMLMKRYGIDLTKLNF